MKNMNRRGGVLEGENIISWILWTLFMIAVGMGIYFLVQKLTS